MNYIVFDLEWNQGSRSNADSPLSFEIIEIGAVKLDDNFQLLDRFHKIIKPVIHPKLFSHTKRIIALTEEDLKQGTTFQKACKEFLNWASKEGDYTFATWGTLDLHELQKNMAFYKITNKFSRPLYYLDIQQLYGIQIGHPSSMPISLENAIQDLKIPKTQTFHSAIHDAEYTAKVLKTIPKTILQNYPAIDTFRFPIYKKQEAYICYPDHSVYVSRAYKTKEALKLASTLRPLYCPICGKRSHRITSWLTSNTKSYYLIGKCSKHGFLKAKRTIKNPDEKHYFETITVKEISSTEKENFLASYKAKKK